MIDFDKFLNWAESRFPGEIIVRGNEIQINTIFPTPSGKPDRDHKLWCNPYGGKNQRKHGVFRCFKSERSGSLITLVMLVDRCDYETALNTLGGEGSVLQEMERELEKWWKNRKKEKEIEEQVPTSISLPYGTYLIDELPSTSFHRVQAEVYLINRKLPTEGLMVCTTGKFRNRIIIPYYDREGKLIYFNGRYIGESDKAPKYKGPNKEIGVGKEDVLYVPEWPKPGDKIYLTEGEFDALTLYVSGKSRGRKMYSGAFGGKNLSTKQIEMIRPYMVVLSLDSDKAGTSGLLKMAENLWASGIKTHLIRPPAKFKDWNKMLEELGPSILLHYIDNYEKELDMVYFANLFMK